MTGRDVEIFNKLKSIVAKQLGVDIEKVTLEAKLNEGLGMDSLDATELIYGVNHGTGRGV